MQEQNNVLFYSEGGVGDTLQHLPFMLLNKKARYCMMNHYKGAKELLRSFGIKSAYTFHYKTDIQKLEFLKSMGLKEPMQQVPRTKYFDNNPFPQQKPLFDNDNPVIGIHLCGSKFSSDGYIKHGQATKTIPADIIHHLSHEYNVILFGLPEEVITLKLKQSNNLKFVTFLDIAKSLSYVSQCHAVVGADSSIKTMSAMLKIPTFVWLADHPDYFRDTVFISPYVDDGVMKIYRYKDAFKEINEGMKATQDFLKGIL
jgi:ADP-heptose:LPS heptosyltransferase